MVADKPDMPAWRSGFSADVLAGLAGDSWPTRLVRRLPSTGNERKWTWTDLGTPISDLDAFWVRFLAFSPVDLPEDQHGLSSHFDSGAPDPTYIAGLSPAEAWHRQGTGGTSCHHEVATYGTSVASGRS